MPENKDDAMVAEINYIVKPSGMVRYNIVGDAAWNRLPQKPVDGGFQDLGREDNELKLLDIVKVEGFEIYHHFRALTKDRRVVRITVYFNRIQELGQELFIKATVKEALKKKLDPVYDEHITKHRDKSYTFYTKSGFAKQWVEKHLGELNNLTFVSVTSNRARFTVSNYGIVKIASPIKCISDDGGRKEAGYKGAARDCVVRSIAIASGQKYKRVYKDLQLLQKADLKSQGRRSRSVRNGVFQESWEPYIKALGFKKVVDDKILDHKVLPTWENIPKTGNFIVLVPNHLTAVVEGVVHDTWNPMLKGIITYYELVEPKDVVFQPDYSPDELPKPVERFTEILKDFGLEVGQTGDHRYWSKPEWFVTLSFQTRTDSWRLSFVDSKPKHVTEEVGTYVRGSKGRMNFTMEFDDFAADVLENHLRDICQERYGI